MPRSPSQKDLRILFVNLSQLLNSGIPIISAIESLTPVATGSIAAVLIELQRAIEGGDQLSEAMNRLPRVFSASQVATISAAESRGSVDEACELVAEGIKRSIELRRRLAKSVAYPILLLLVAIFVLPIRELILGDPGTYFMGVVRNLAILAIVLGGGFWLSRSGRTVVRSAPGLLRLLWTIPGVRRLYLTNLRTVFCRTLSEQIDAGLTMAQAIDNAAVVCADPEAKRRGQIVIAEIRGGAPLAESLLRNELIGTSEAPTLVSGEKSGHLVESLAVLAAEYQSRFARNLKATLTVLAAAILLAVMISVAFAVVDAYSNILGQTDDILENLGQ